MKKELEPGTDFGGYKVVRRIGVGGMANVYEARQTNIGKRVALKVLHAYLALRADVVQRFVQEARAASRIEHPHVVGITDIGVEQGQPFIAMDLLEGEELSAILEREGGLPVGRLVDLMLPVISAVAAAHEKNILHRDLKPENVFIARRRAYDEHPVLVDFGISKIREEGSGALTAVGEVLGTPPYMAPEQVINGMGHFDARSDQYALGVLLYEASTGTLPFRNEQIGQLMVLIAKGGATPPSTIRPGIPRAFEEVVTRAMSVNPEDRFASVQELGKALLPQASPFVRAMWAGEFGEPIKPVAPRRVSGAGFAAVAPRPKSVPPPKAPAQGAWTSLSASDLRALPCLTACADPTLDAFLAVAPGSRFTAGSTLYAEGDAGGGSLFLLLTGQVTLEKGPDARAVGTVKGPAPLGAMTLGGGPRTVAAVAASDCVVVELPKDVFESLHEKHPEVAARLNEQLALDGIRRMRFALARLSALTSGRPREPAAQVEELGRLGAAIAEWSVELDAASQKKKPLER